MKRKRFTEEQIILILKEQASQRPMSVPLKQRSQFPA